jgi:sulfite exporter TauE/SafE
MTFLLAGFALGVAGSVHCLVMCGPLILALRGAAGPRNTWASAALHHAGRLLVYQVFAIAAALTGKALALGGLDRVLSVTCGAILIASALPLGTRLLPTSVAAVWMRALTAAGGRMRRLAGSHQAAAAFAGGIVNGLLPCGLTYGAAAVAAASGHVSSAMLTMAGFGAGTLPTLALLAVPVRESVERLRPRLRLAAPLVLAAAGLLLIVRGIVPTAISHPSHGVIVEHVVHRH